MWLYVPLSLATKRCLCDGKRPLECRVDPPTTTSTAPWAPQTPQQCAAALAKYCPTLRAKKDSCLVCLSAHPAKFFDGACTHSELSDYCDKTAPPCPKCPPPGPPPPPPPPPPKGQLLRPVFARELPQLTPQQLADPACQGGLIRTKDGMDSFFGHALINVSNSLGPHCKHLYPCLRFGLRQIVRRKTITLMLMVVWV